MFIPVNGFVRVIMKESTLKVGLRLTTQMAGKKKIGAFEVVSADLGINGNILKFDMGGSFMADFVELFMPIFRWRIAADIEKNVESALRNGLPQAMNSIL